MPACKSCGRPIRFLDTTSGKRMPVDPDLMRVVLLSDSSRLPLRQRRLIIQADGQAVRGVEPSSHDHEPGVGVAEGYVPHWATCTHPEQHRERLVTWAEAEMLATIAHRPLNPVLVGQAPMQRRLAAWAGIGWEGFQESFDRAAAIYPALRVKLQHRVTVLLGGGVAQSLGCGCFPRFRWHLCGALGGLSATIPYPSGQNHAYHTHEAQNAAGRILREARLIAAGEPAAVYAALARDYDLQYRRPLDDAENRVVERRLRDAVGASRRVLDLGAGTGLGLRLLLKGAWTGDYIGLDLVMASPGLPGLRRAPGVRWVQADMGAPPFKRETFDAVISLFGAFSYADGPATLRATARVLRPGGRLFLMAYGPRYRSRESYVMNRLKLPVRHRAWTRAALEVELLHAGLIPTGWSGLNWQVDARADGFPSEALVAALEMEVAARQPLEDALFLIATAVKP